MSFLEDDQFFDRCEMDPDGQYSAARARYDAAAKNEKSVCASLAAANASLAAIKSLLAGRYFAAWKAWSDAARALDTLANAKSVAIETNPTNTYPFLTERISSAQAAFAAAKEALAIAEKDFTGLSGITRGWDGDTSCFCQACKQAEAFCAHKVPSTRHFVQTSVPWCFSCFIMAREEALLAREDGSRAQFLVDSCKINLIAARNEMKQAKTEYFNARHRLYIAQCSAHSNQLGLPETC